jgi:DNA replication ATP-dependent helicase Dna2
LGPLSDILDGIEEEMRVASRPLRFRISNTINQGEIWKLFVEPMDASSSLDESMEGSGAWWAGPPSGSADVLSVVPDSDQINIRYLTNPPPERGQEIRIYQPRYLEALRDCWESSDWATCCLAWLDKISQQPRDLGNTSPIEDFPKLPTAQLGKIIPQPPDLGDISLIEGFPKLRTAQRQAFGLLEREYGFLWGPPGTGKTYTLGAMLAHYLCHRPTSRILLFSTTNPSVDLALISVDERLEEMSRVNSTANQLRKKCVRIGNHFVASKYRGREHLLPTLDENLVRRLADLEAKVPEPADVIAYAAWKDQVKGLRARVPKSIDQARLAAMTTTGAAFYFNALHKRRPYDLIVFDEASQVSLVHALALMPLGKQVIFAGDDRQLAPIVQSEHAQARSWLGRSVFVYKSTRGTCLLDEQTRMEESICDLVSRVFYDGKLVVARDCEADPIWRSSRVVRDVPPMGRKNVYLHRCEQEGQFTGNYGGPVRFASADFVGTLVERLLTTLSADQISVLCPYRAQRSILKASLRRRNISNVRVSTVHRAQGSECHTVIFDAVLANTRFLNNDDIGPRLLNVALSRAQSRLVLVHSAGDLSNKWLRRIVKVISGRHGAQDDALPV